MHLISFLLSGLLLRDISMTLLSGNGRPEARSASIARQQGLTVQALMLYLRHQNTAPQGERKMNNSVSFAGYVGNAPIERNIQNKKLAIFSLAVKQFKAQGETETMWLDCEAWEALAGRVLNHVAKGREVLIHGRLALSTYIDKDGVKVIKPIVKLAGFYLCGPKKSPDDSGNVVRTRQTAV
jgi:hypothetical protein